MAPTATSQPPTLGTERYPDVDPDFVKWARELQRLSWAKAVIGYDTFLAENPSDAQLAVLGLLDRYFLLTELLGRVDFLNHGTRGNTWLYDRCREVEAAPDDYLDLWARDAYKSSIITNGGVIQEVLRDPEITCVIFGGTNKIAKPFLGQIKYEFETNAWLKRIYADVLWEEPRTQAPQWSIDGGIIVKRQGNPKEATVEAHGLIDGMPTGKHWNLRVYDDLVNEDLVGTPEQIKKCTLRWENSDNLGTKGGRRWHIGTRYSYADTYGIILDRGVLKVRKYPATDDGTLNGRPVFLTQAQWDAKKLAQVSVINAQMLQDPLAGEQNTFDLKSFRTYEARPRTVNVYILVDPSKGATQRSTYTGIAVIGVDAASNRYLLDGYRQRMSLDQRYVAVKHLHKYWSHQPGVQAIRVGYERYGMQSDLEHFELEMRRERAFFPIEEVSWPRQGKHSKEDRIERIEPDARHGHIFLPAYCWHEVHGTCIWLIGQDHVEFRRLLGETKIQREMRATDQGYRLAKPIKRKAEGHVYDLTRVFLEEARLHPFGSHEDLLDAFSRLYDMDPVPPVMVEREQLEPPVYIDGV